MKDSTHNDIILNILIEIAGYEPVALNGFLPMLKEIGERFPYLIGQMARIYGTVGHVDEVSLVFFSPFPWIALALNPTYLIYWSSMTYKYFLGFLGVPIYLSILLHGQWPVSQVAGLCGRFRKWVFYYCCVTWRRRVKMERAPKDSRPLCSNNNQ